MNIDQMTGRIETERLVLFPYTAENLALFNRDLPAFEECFGVIYRGEELDHLLTGFLLGLEKEIAAGTDAFPAADANGDQKVTAADARLILRASVGLENL